MNDAEKQERLRVVGLGIEAEEFIRSPLGRYMTARAEREREEALQQLVEANPHEPTAVQILQNRVRVVDMTQQWIADVILEGQATEQALLIEEAEGGSEPPPPA